MKYLITAITFFWAITIHANNVQIRTCNITNGHFWTLDVLGDNIGFCNYNGAMLDSLSVMEKVYKNKHTKASAAVLSTKIYDSCLNAGAILSVGVDSNNQSHEVCIFPDSSLLLKESLLEGPLSRFNSMLIQALHFQ